MHIMDNEASNSLKTALIKNSIAYQLVPPHLHRRNMVERAIQTFKAHFIACLHTAPSTYPAKEWDRLLPQCELTLNLMRPSRHNPKLSAHNDLFGIYDFNKTPLAPPGTKCVIRDKPSHRATWAPRGTDAWYTGPAPEHYRCVTCYVPKTNSVRIADTVQYLPTLVPLPQVSTEDLLRKTAQDILAILNNPHPPAPCLTITDETREAIKNVAVILNRATPCPPPVASTPATTEAAYIP